MRLEGGRKKKITTMKGNINKKIEERNRTKVSKLTILTPRDYYQDESIRRNERKCSARACGEGSLGGGLLRHRKPKTMCYWVARRG